MAVAANPTLLTAVDHFDDGQNDDDDNNYNNDNNSSSDDRRAMRRRMPTGRHHPSGGRYRLDAGIVRSQYSRVVSIGGHRREFGM